MSLEQYKDASRKELWEILQIQMQVLQAQDLEQTRKGFWLGFEDARCHPGEMNILSQWEGTKVFKQAKALEEQVK
jgi:hypothetical protein